MQMRLFRTMATAVAIVSVLAVLIVIPSTDDADGYAEYEVDGFVYVYNDGDEVFLERIVSEHGEKVVMASSITVDGKELKVTGFYPDSTWKDVRTVVISEYVDSVDIDQVYVDLCGIGRFEVVPENASFMATSDGLLLSKDGSTLVRVGPGFEGDVRIPDGTVRIGDWAFCGCSKVTEIDLNRVEYIGQRVFDYTDLGGKDVVLPSSLTKLDGYLEIGNVHRYIVEEGNEVLSCDDQGLVYERNGNERVVVGIGSLEGTITIAADVISLGMVGTNDVRDVDLFVVEDGNTKYRPGEGPYVQYYSKYQGECILLVAGAYDGIITIPAEIQYIHNMGSVHVRQGFAVEEGNENYAADENGILYSYDMKVIHNIPQTVTGDLSVKEGVTSATDGVFGNLDNVTSITFPEGFSPFIFRIWGCDNLESLTLPESMSKTALLNISKMESLERITFTGHTFDIGKSYTFIGADGETEVTSDYDTGITFIRGDDGRFYDEAYVPPSDDSGFPVYDALLVIVIVVVIIALIVARAHRNH